MPIYKNFSEQIGLNFYCIKNRNGEYWNNQDGWVEVENQKEISNYEIFTEHEKSIYNLPIGGFWELI